jgi:hypothetical protein
MWGSRAVTDQKPPLDGSEDTILADIVIAFIIAVFVFGAVLFTIAQWYLEGCVLC